jgi:HAD superfamily hydrolase (TIGR01509 family)
MKRDRSSVPNRFDTAGNGSPCTFRSKRAPARRRLETRIWMAAISRCGSTSSDAHEVAVPLEVAHARAQAAYPICEAEPVQPGVRDRLEEARDAGMGTAVASSSSRAWVEPWLSRHGLRHLVDVVCTRDDVVRVKPAPDLFLLAAERLGVDPSGCVVFEDSPNGLLAARAASMWAVAVPRGLTRSLPLPAPDAVIESLAAHTLAELRAVLDGSRASRHTVA